MRRVHTTVRIPIFAATLVIAAACGCGAVLAPAGIDSVSASPTAERGRHSDAAGPTIVEAQALAAGELHLPAAGSFGEPGFHEVLTAAPDLPLVLGPTAGLRLVLRLRDAGRPGQTCSRDHPLSGCATVDWSDSASRPGVPPGGVFGNTLTLRLASGERTFFLSESGSLNDGPDPFMPS